MTIDVLMRFPKAMRIGNNVLEDFLVKDIRICGGKKVLLVTDPGIVKAGLAKIIMDILEKGGISYDVFSDVEPEPSLETVRACISFAKTIGADLFVGLGGGSAMDVCKATALCLSDDSDVLDLIGQETVTRPGKPVILIPTTSGSGSEGSPSIVLSDHSNNTKKAIWSRYVMADCIFVDPVSTMGLPARITGETGVDVLSHSIEAYVSKRANSITDMLALEALRMIGRSLVKAYQNGKDKDARLDMQKASFLAGMAFGGAGLGCIHALAYPYTTLFGHPHGRAQGMGMPNVLRFNSVGNEKRFAEIGEALGVNTDGLTDKEAADKTINSIEQLINSVGISTNLADYEGITPDRFQEMAEIAILSNGRLLATNPRDMTVEQAVEIYQKSYHK